MAVTVIKERCPQNHPCPAVKLCPTDALSQKGFDAPEVDDDKCIDCGVCSDNCPMGAFKPEGE
ncbi:MAG: 4Fe-4S binding protein [Armatimonadota bacterium]